MGEKSIEIGHGMELYNEVQRLIFEWYGRDATEQSALMGQLVADIVRVARGYDGHAAALAAHDGAEAI